ncbi:apolipoprotein N-acyltransferase [Thermoproteota archaeon]
MKIKTFIYHLALLFISALLIGQSFFNPALGIFLFIALIPTYFSLDALSHVKGESVLLPGFVLGYCFGVMIFLQGFYWLGKLNVPLTIFAIGYSALYIGIFFVAVIYYRIRNQKAPFFLIIPICWTILEYIRGNFLLAFTGASLGYGLVFYKPLIQIARIVGLHGVTFFILFINGTIFYALRYKKKRIYILFLTILALGTVFFYGKVVMQQDLKGARRIKVAAIQGHLSKEMHALYENRNKVMDTYGRLARRASEHKPALIVFPEATIEGDILDPRGQDILTFYRRTAQETGAYLLTGARHTSQKDSKDFLYNSAYMFDPKGGVPQIYDKIKLVPFFEHVIFSDRFDALKKLRLRDINFFPGNELTVFDAPWGSFSVLICFEGLFPDLTRKFVKNGAELLINICNDDDLGDDLQVHNLDSAMSIFRAIENHRYLIRCSRWGAGLVVDPFGRIVNSAPFGKEAIMVHDVELFKELTLYSRFGDFLVYLLALLFIYPFLAHFWSTRHKS